MNKRAIGAEEEARAAEYLEAQGYRILQRNFRCRAGEIDIVALDRNERPAAIVFVEVKYRRGRGAGLPEEAVDARKQRTILRVAQFYRTRYQLDTKTPLRFDVIAIEGTALRHYKNAFGGW